MKTKYIIGVDGGSQSSKVVIFDLQGTIVSEGRELLKPMMLSERGKVEHPDDDLWDSIILASRKAMKHFKGNKEDIIGLGLCTIRFCRCLLKADGTLASPVMSWMDTRVSKPYEHRNRDVNYVTTSTGYITHRFTGNFNDTAGNYQGMWPIDTDTWQWSEDKSIFQEYNIPKEMLFNLQMPGTILGHVTETAAELTGFPAGIPVIATANDKAVEALGAGLLSNKTGLISLGTYIAGMVHGQKNPKNTTHFWTNFSAIANQYLYESHGIRRGMWTISWFKELFGADLLKKGEALGVSAEEYLNLEAQKVKPGSDGLMTILDWLAPTGQPYKKGLMMGFDGRHTRAHMYRSLLEAIALQMKLCMDNMCEELEIELTSLIISGGGSNSELMMQIFADVFGIPASRTVVNGSASLGSAICVAVALGEYPDYETAVEKMVKKRDCFQPNLDHFKLYTRMNKEVYQYIPQYTDEIFKKSYSIFS
ncbi:FGGY-family carbohydrate kinase [Alkalihalobacillus oceani]|uniref:FGGY-family carbohydrate kinase n=1 Tax=Halalkalibacter oceani TaxID=1653776 RepID=UPI00203E1CA2|nr:FGGY-family carbohydrate kinase [Halalkalibacter oceani]MCM3761447.1 FGGY-family carbohydrate kinase [Halalkalibacter oceani]